MAPRSQSGWRWMATSQKFAAVAGSLLYEQQTPRSWVLRQENRTSWDDDLEIGDAIKGLQQQAQRDGRAQPLVSTYLVATQEDHRHAAKIQKKPSRM